MTYLFESTNAMTLDFNILVRFWCGGFFVWVFLLGFFGWLVVFGFFVLFGLCFVILCFFVGVS